MTKDTTNVLDKLASKCAKRQHWKMGSVSQKKKKKKDCLLFGFTVPGLHAVNAHALTGCAHDNNPARSAHSIIGVVQLQ